MFGKQKKTGAAAAEMSPEAEKQEPVEEAAAAEEGAEASAASGTSGGEAASETSASGSGEEAALLAAAQHRSDRAKAWRRYEKLALPDLGLDYAAAYRNETSFPTVVLRRGSTVQRLPFVRPMEKGAGTSARSSLTGRR